MKIAKEFRWEMGHRLPEHFGKCKNVHGHSYRMIIEIEGQQNESGMVMDYYDLSAAVAPVIEEMDHAFMVSGDDKDVIAMLEKVNSKKIIVEFPSTVENICVYIMDRLNRAVFPKTIDKIRVRIYETNNDYAELESSF